MSWCKMEDWLMPDLSQSLETYRIWLANLTSQKAGSLSQRWCHLWRFRYLFLIWPLRDISWCSKHTAVLGHLFCLNLMPVTHQDHCYQTRGRWRKKKSNIVIISIYIQTFHFNVLASTNQCLRFLPTFIDSAERRSTIAFLETRRIRLEFYSNLLFNRIRCTERWIRMRTKTNACWSKIISKYYLRIPSKGSGEHIFTLSLYPIPKRTPRKPDSNLN